MAVAVEITRRAVLRPRDHHHGEDSRTVPLTVFDRASTDGYIPALFAWTAQAAPTNAALVIDGLLATVARFPHLAGRMGVDGRGRQCFHLNNAGVLVVEATAAAGLADALALSPAPHIKQLYPKADTARGVDEPILQVQLTRYSCGGLVIGTACNHRVADGLSMSSFFAAWAAAVRSGLAVLPSPFTDRAAAAVARSPPAPAFDHRNVDFMGEERRRSSDSQQKQQGRMTTSLAVHFPVEFVAGLKAHASARCSTFKCLLAYAWRKVTAARPLAPDQLTQVRVAVDCRGRASPPMPADFFGNMVLWAFPRMRAGELLSATYAAVAGVIRDSVARIDAEYIQSFVDFGQVLADAVRGAGGDGEEDQLASTAACRTGFCPDLEVDSWLGFGFHDLDFGGGPPFAFLQPDLPIEGLMLFVPSCAPNPKGGVHSS